MTRESCLRHQPAGAVEQAAEVVDDAAGAVEELGRVLDQGDALIDRQACGDRAQALGREWIQLAGALRVADRAHQSGADRRLELGVLDPVLGGERRPRLGGPQGDGERLAADVQLAGGAVERRERELLRGLLEPGGLTPSTRRTRVGDGCGLVVAAALLLGTVSLFVGFLLVTTLVTVSVNERIGEITVMRALGVSKLHIVQQIVLEGVVITLAGALAGLALGLVTARYLNSILASFPGLPVDIDFFLFQPRAAWTALGLLSLSGIAAGIYPSLRAASLPIATTLREEAIA